MVGIAEMQRNYFKGGSTREIGGRISNLRKLKQLIIKYEKDIWAAIGKDLGRHAVEAFLGETIMATAEIDFMIKNIERCAKPKKVKTPLLFFGGRATSFPNHTEPS